jgi:hypothetical protein
MDHLLQTMSLEMTELSPLGVTDRSMEVGRARGVAAMSARHGMRCLRRILGGLFAATLVASSAAALPIELRDGNGTRYQVNTDVDPLITESNASGALTNATFLKSVTVTSYWIGFTPWFGWTTFYTVHWTAKVPLTNAFAGFNGLLVTGIAGTTLTEPIAFNPGDVPAGEDCPQDGKNRQIIFQTQDVPALGLALTRKVFVTHKGEFARWLNIVTNTNSTPIEVDITLQGLLGSGSDTRVTATSSGGSSVGAADLWFATAEHVPPGIPSTIPKVGFVVQGEAATSPVASAAINSLGVAVVTYRPTIPAGERIIIATFVTVQGGSKRAKKVSEKLVDLPSGAIACLTQDELYRIVNFAPIGEPELKHASVALRFRNKKTDRDTIEWKGRIAIGAGLSLAGLPVSVDVGGVTEHFVLDDEGKASNGGGNKFRLAASLDENGRTKAARVEYSLHLRGDFKAPLAEYGLVDETVRDVPVVLPVTLTVGEYHYAAERSLTYGAKEGKTGKAKNVS